jgi:hypothetical protein
MQQSQDAASIDCFDILSEYKRGRVCFWISSWWEVVIVVPARQTRYRSCNCYNCLLNYMRDDITHIQLQDTKDDDI